MFDELKAMADRHAELYADRAQLAADVDRLTADLEQARRPWRRQGGRFAHGMTDIIALIVRRVLRGGFSLGIISNDGQFLLRNHHARWHPELPGLPTRTSPAHSKQDTTSSKLSGVVPCGPLGAL
jgi:hypothetical protein